MRPVETSLASKIVIFSPLSRTPGFHRVRSLVPAAWEVPMGAMDALLELVVVALVIVFATAVILYVTGRAWRRRHTYVEDFWQRGGW